MIKNTFTRLNFWIRVIILLIFSLHPSYIFYTKQAAEIEAEIPMIEEPAVVTPVIYPSVFALDEEDKVWIEQTMANMSLREKIAQMIMPWAYGSELKESSAQYERFVRLSKYTKVGGFIFFQGDIENTAKNINFLQENSDVPLLISADFERGLGYRLSDATEFPSHMSVTAAEDVNLAYQMGKIIALESRAIGVHQNFAPVADINNNPFNPIINNRSFSEDKGLVSQYSIAFIRGSKAGRMISTAKHFPGHGNTNVDSHKELPTILLDRINLANNELVPFTRLIKAGVPSVMIGHLYVPALEPYERIPSSLSRRIVTDLLQAEMGFDGLIVTDAMNMNAVTNYYSVGEASVLAVKAGNDIILMPPDEELAINSIYFAVEDGEISQERIDHSVRKILAAKRWLKLDKNKITPIGSIKDVIGKRQHLRLSREIAERSVTLVKNDDGIIPLDPSAYKNIAFITINDAAGDKRGASFQSMIQDNLKNVTTVYLNRKSKERDFNVVNAMVNRADLIILSVYLDISDGQETSRQSKNLYSLIEDILTKQKPVVLLSLENPYVLAAFPDAKTYLCSYGDVTAVRRAMIDALLGSITIKGVLPVSIPNTHYGIGSGLKLKSSRLVFTGVEEHPLYDFNDVNELMQNALDKKIFPGGVLLAAHRGRVIYEKPFGCFTFDSSSTPVMKEAMFDLASLTKVVAATTAAMILNDEGKLDPEQFVEHYLPGFGKNGKEQIKVKNLLLHNAGFGPSVSYKDLYSTKEEIIKSIFEEKLQYPAGSRTVYSDAGMILLQLIIEKISGTTLDKFVSDRIFSPLGMKRTMFNPGMELWYYCLPTSNEYDRVKRNKGVVHDYYAFLMGGVSGHSGLFSTARDLAVFLQMMLQNGFYNGIQLIKPSTVTAWTKRDGQNLRAFGWDVKSSETSPAGKHFSEISYGHTGHTGTSVWVDPERELFVVLLTNGVFPDGKNTGMLNFRPELHDAVIKVVEK